MAIYRAKQEPDLKRCLALKLMLMKEVNFPLSIPNGPFKYFGVGCALKKMPKHMLPHIGRDTTTEHPETIHVCLNNLYCER